MAARRKARPTSARKRARSGSSDSVASAAQLYQHPESDLPLRPEVGTQSEFKKKKPPKSYRYDSSLSPVLDWDGQNSAREQGEALIAEILRAETIEDARAAAERLRRLGAPFLNWAGKAERLSFDVPTLPLFVHERLSTKAILETLKGHTRNQQQELDLFADPKRSIADQLLRAYEYRDRWVNRMILGDSLVVMNSLLDYEGLGGKVQMIYIDPPYGVRFGSNFQPFVRKRDVEHNDDDDMTREPEMVQAYRDTWELGLHSYLSYLRDRLLVARELLTPSGSVFVQISDENLHHVREVMDEVFGSKCAVVTLLVKKKGSQKSSLVDPVNDYLLWYSKSPRAESAVRFRPLFTRREIDSETLSEFRTAELPDGRQFAVARAQTPEGELFDYRLSPRRLFQDFPEARLYRPWPITNGGTRLNQMDPIELDGTSYHPPTGRCWSYRSRRLHGEGVAPMERLREKGRLVAGRRSLDGKRYLDDFPFQTISNWWDGLGGAADPVYVVQTNPQIVARCMLMATDPGDLVLDPTCGSGTTAYVAEQWGRRWITIDTSRVPLALARQRLLTATFPWYELSDDKRGPAGGFVYKRKQNNKGEEVGGIVPHITLKSIANDEPPAQEVLVDRPEQVKGITRVSGPFVFEATIPTPVDWEGDGVEDSGIVQISQDHASFVERMLEVLRRSPNIRLEGNRNVTLRNIRPPARALVLSAEAIVDPSLKTGLTPPDGTAAVVTSPVSNGNASTAQHVAIVFGPESGAVVDKLVFEAVREARAKDYSHLYVIGFGIQPGARELIEKSDEAFGIAATYVQMTPDVLMGDLLKNMRSSQIFSVCGLPEIEVTRVVPKQKGDPERWQVELLGLDVFDPVTMENDKRNGDDVPAWFLDTDYNDLVFHVDQAFFPRTSAWDNLKRALRTTYEEGVWDHLAGAKSAPFEAGEHRKVAVKVIDDRGNELMVVRVI